MKKNSVKLAVISLLLLCAMAVQLCGCVTEVQAADLMAGITPNAVQPQEDLKTQSAAVTDFAVRLFQAGNAEGKNVLISPLSVMCALAMTANGADGQTLTQMETVLGMTTRELNAYLYSYMKSLPQGEKYKLSMANSIWLTDHERFTAERDFLQTNADYYGADIYRAPMDQQTCDDINLWVKEKTDGMIPQILDQIPESAIMYLINALAFDAEWAGIYMEYQSRDGEFTTEAGTKRNVKLMHSEEGIYLSNDKATGFVKHYAGGKYAFVAMLPNEGVSLGEYVSSMDGVALQKMLEAPQYCTVRAAIPKFQNAYATEMSELLADMGMPDAFDPYSANFSKLGTSAEGNISISRVIHKTFIAVDEQGTKAGAATVIEATDGCAMVDPQEIKEVILDRPFVYMLIDCENNLPFFLGTMLDPAA